jgi:glycosyltransferase involved in cell wall biosynthesis
MADSLHIIGSNQFGGADHFYVRLVQALNECGHRAVAVNRPDTPISKALDGKVEQIHVPMRNVWDIFSVLAIRRLVHDCQAPIVQTYMGRASRLTRVRRSSKAIHIARLGNYYKIKGYYGHAHAWVVNTRGVRDYLVGHGLPAKRVYLISNFVEMPPPMEAERLVGLRNSLNIPNEATVVFSLGRFIRIKGISDLLVAFSLLPCEVQGRPIYLVVAGDGPLREQLQTQAETLALNPRLRWVGWQNDPSPYYDVADVFVCPSHHETLGNVILEAWAHHLPVVATQTPGAMDLIQDGNNGFLVPCRDPGALAKRLLEVLQAGVSTWQSVGAEGMQRLAANHSQETVVSAYLAMYEELQRTV